jgi:para-nitrobenzyl esterase
MRMLAPCASQDQRHRAGALEQGKETVAALEDGDVGDWRTASPEQMVKPHGQGPLAGPVYGGRLLPRTPQEAFATGEFHKVPVLQGINQDEGRVIAFGMELGKRKATGDPNARIEEADYHAFLEGEFGKEQAAVIAERYPVEAYDDTPALALAAALTDGTWARSAIDTGRALSAQVPTYTFEFADREVPWYADEEKYRS